MAVDLSYLEKQGNFNEALDPLVAAVDKWKKDQADAEKEQRAQQHENEIMRRDDMRYQSSLRRQDLVDARERQRIDLEERRYQGGVTLQNRKAQADTEAKIRAALASGDEATASMLARGYSQMEPATGAVQQGIPFQRLPGAPAPGAPPTLEPEARAEGPRISADDAERADLLRSLDQPGEVTTSRDARAAMQAGDQAADSATAHNQIHTEAYNRQIEAYRGDQDNPRYKIGDTEVSQNDLRYAAANKDASDFESYANSAVPANDPDATAYVKMLAGAVRGRGMSAQQAAKALDDYKRTGFKQDFTAGQNEARFQNNLDVQRLRNQRPVAFNPNAAANLNEKQVALVNTDLDRFQRSYQVGPTRQEISKINDLMHSGDNVISQRSAANWLMRIRAGEKGVTTDRDREYILGTLTGTLGSVDAALQKMENGQLPPEQWRVVQQALGQSLAAAQQRRSDAMRAYAGGIRTNPTYNAWGLGQHLDAKAEEIFGPGGAQEVQDILNERQTPIPGADRPGVAAQAAHKPNRPHADEIIPGVRGRSSAPKESNEQRKARLLRELSGGGQ